MTAQPPSGPAPQACPIAGLGDAGLVLCLERHRHMAALGEIFRRHGGAVHDLATRICGPERGTDVVEAVFVDLWHGTDGFDPERSSLHDHLLARAHARAVEPARVDHLRRVRLTTLLGRGPGTGPEEQAMTAAMVSRVGTPAWSLLATLGREERTAIALTYYGGYGAGELAGLLSRTEPAVHRQLRSGMASLGSRGAGPTGQRSVATRSAADRLRERTSARSRRGGRDPQWKQR